jgi:hypothetical protein
LRREIQEPLTSCSVLYVFPRLCPDLLNVCLHDHISIVPLVLKRFQVLPFGHTLALSEHLLHRVESLSVFIVLVQSLLSDISLEVILVVPEHGFVHVNLECLQIRLLSNKPS